MKGNKLINLGDANNPTDASNKKYVDTIANSIFDGSEPFQVDISTNNYIIKYVHTSVNDYDAVNKHFLRNNIS